VLAEYLLLDSLINPSLQASNPVLFLEELTACLYIAVFIYKSTQLQEFSVMEYLEIIFGEDF